MNVTAPGEHESELISYERALIDAAAALCQPLDTAGVASAMLTVAERVFAAQSAWILLYDRASDTLGTVEFRGPGSDAYSGVRVPADVGIVGLAFQRRETVFVPDVSEETRWFDPARVQRSGLRSVFTVPIVAEDEALGIVGIDSPLFSGDNPPGDEDIRRLRGIAALAGIGIQHARVVEEIERDRSRLQQLLAERRHLRSHVSHLQDQIRDVHGPESPIGRGPAFAQVLNQVELVAPSDSTVLLIGETGTGKELIARSLHVHSRRASHPFITVNCAALPEALVESELFGHEKGAFTGAVGRTTGKFELANKGTLFLDEIGDLPSQAQSKLLRVLQEREVELVGGTRPIPVDVRLIAATNQDLESCMRAGQFRPDLFYRLNVFPMRLPPLRERREDIPDLVAHFARLFCERQHKPPMGVGAGVLERLLAYDWPGNIRELQNVIERAVILSRDAVIQPDAIVLPARRSLVAHGPSVHLQGEGTPPMHDERTAATARVTPFSEAERLAIVRALETSGWRISGAGGAAEALGLKPTTLHAKMKKLGVRRPSGASAAVPVSAPPAP